MRTATASPIRGDWATDGAPSKLLAIQSMENFGELAVEKSTGPAADRQRQLGRPRAGSGQNLSRHRHRGDNMHALDQEGKLTSPMAIHDKVRHRWMDEELALIKEELRSGPGHISSACDQMLNYAASRQPRRSQRHPRSPRRRPHGSLGASRGSAKASSEDGGSRWPVNGAVSPATSTTSAPSLLAALS